jgi:hypothetical protein
MTDTNIAAVQTAIQTFWPTLFQDQLRQTNLLYQLVNREYSGALQAHGDTVKVNQVNATTGERLTISGATGRTFTPEALSLSSVSVTVDQRLVASYDIEDLVWIQSLIDPMGTSAQEVRAAMVQGISNQLNTYLYSLVAPTTTIPSVTTMTAATVALARETAALAKWSYNKPWYSLLAPQYYSDLLTDTTMTNSDYTGTDLPVINGQIAKQRYGFNIYEDNTQSISATSGGLFFHPDFMYLVTQMEPRFKISDKHSSHEFAAVLSVDMLIGAKLGIQGAARHIKVQTGA